MGLLTNKIAITHIVGACLHYRLCDHLLLWPAHKWERGVVTLCNTIEHVVNPQ